MSPMFLNELSNQRDNAVVEVDDTSISSYRYPIVDVEETTSTPNISITFAGAQSGYLLVH